MKRFGGLPRAGGVLDQPGRLAEELRIVVDAFEDEAARIRKRKQQAAAPARSSGTARRPRGRR
jgi:hypothetical protein